MRLKRNEGVKDAKCKIKSHSQASVELSYTLSNGKCTIVNNVQVLVGYAWEWSKALKKFTENVLLLCVRYSPSEILSELILKSSYSPNMVLKFGQAAKISINFLIKVLSTC